MFFAQGAFAASESYHNAAERLLRLAESVREKDQNRNHKTLEKIARHQKLLTQLSAVELMNIAPDYVSNQILSDDLDMIATNSGWDACTL